VADRVGVSEHPAQRSGANHLLDLASRDARVQQLGASDDTVLDRRNCGHGMEVVRWFGSHSDRLAQQV
jgi:hypothetical protein